MCGGRSLALLWLKLLRRQAIYDEVQFSGVVVQLRLWILCRWKAHCFFRMGS